MAEGSGFDPMSQEYEAQYFGFTPKSFSDGSELMHEDLITT